MTEVFIKHNPYTVETQILIDEKPLAQGSSLEQFIQLRLQLWVEALPDTLIRELNEDNFLIKFHGIRNDFEDLREVINKYNERKGTEIELIHSPGKEGHDIIAELKKLFEEMQQGPFEELRDPALVEKFNEVMDSEFSVSVLATMSSGKSTLINALLGRELMPSKQEACTASIATIKDNDDFENFIGQCYDSEGNIVIERQEINYEKMLQYNNDPNISKVEIEGNIPNISSERMKLVLVDTPGPNYSRDLSHREYTYRIIKHDTKPVVLYIMNATQLHTEDDKALLSVVAAQMKVGGKQSKDRFLFAINKLDDYDVEKNDDIESAIGKTTEYLREQGIEHPNIFPVSAELAKLIRMKQNEQILSKKQDRFLMTNVMYFNEEESMHLESCASLSPLARETVLNKLDEARRIHDEMAEALCHSGIIAIEVAINEYLDKYAIPTKVLNAVNSFRKIIEEKQLNENLLLMIRDSEEKRQEMLNQIQRLEEELTKGSKVKDLKRAIDKLDVWDDYNEKKIVPLTAKVEKKLRELAESAKVGEVTVGQALLEYDKLRRNVENIHIDLSTDLEKTSKEMLKNVAQQLFDKYKNCVEHLVEDRQGLFNFGKSNLLTIDIPEPEQIISQYKFDKRVKVGEETVRNPDYIPFLDAFINWFRSDEKPKYISQAIYESREYIKFDDLVDQVIVPIREKLYLGLANVEEFIKEQNKGLKNYFSEKTIDLLKQLKIKITQMKEISNNKKDLENNLTSQQKEWEWLNRVSNELNNILEV